MCDSALAQHLRTRDDVLGLNLVGGGEAVTTSSEESEAVEDILLRSMVISREK
jgi:hypothetical protein